MKLLARALVFKTYVLKTLACALLTCSQIALADELYNCGKNYQESPCNNSTVTKPIGRKTAPAVLKPAISNNAAKPVIVKPANIKFRTLAANASCKQRAEVAKEIAALRDAGKTEVQQLKTSDSSTHALIKDVYGRRGSSLQVQYNVERECMQLKERDRLTQKQMGESEMLRNGGVVTPINRPTNEIPLQTEAVELPEKPELAKKSARIEPVEAQQPTTIAPAVTLEPVIPVTKKTKLEEKPLEQGDELGICRSFKAGLESLASQKRKGGDASQMKDLGQQQEQLTREMQLAGC